MSQHSLKTEKAALMSRFLLNLNVIGLAEILT